MRSSRGAEPTVASPRVRWRLGLLLAAAACAALLVLLAPSRRGPTAPRTTRPVSALELPASDQQEETSISVVDRDLIRATVARARAEKRPAAQAKRPATVIGRVIDASGGPVVGATVSARSLTTRFEIEQVLTDAAGEFGLASAPGPIEIVALAEAYSRAALTADAPVSGLTLVLAPRSRIGGRVVQRETGLPVADVSVLAENQNGIRALTATAIAGPEGDFLIDDLAAGGYSVHATSASYRSDPQWVNVGVGQTSAPLTVFVDRATTLTTTLRVGGKPCEDGAIEVSGPIDSVAQADASGRARVMGLVPGRYTLLARCADAVPLRETVEVGTEPTQLSLDLQRGLELRGEVVSHSGRAVSGLTVQVQPVLENATPEALQAASLLVRQCVSDVDGRFACTGLLEGAYDCLAAARGDALSDRLRVVLTRDTADVVLRVASSASIRVKLPGNSKLQGRTVLARRAERLPVSATRDADEYVFEHLALGSYDVYVGMGSDAGPDARRVELSREGQVASLSLDVPATRSLGGRVIDAEGQPVPDAWVRAAGVEALVPDNYEHAVLTDDQGAFSLEGLHPGAYRVRATHAHGEGEAQVSEAGATNVVVRLASYGSLSGVVTAPGGDSQYEGTLEYGLSEEGTDQIAVRTGARWTLPWLPPGTYQLSVTSEAGAAHASVTLAPGARLDVPLMLSAPVITAPATAAR